MSLNKRLFAAAPSAGPAFNIVTYTGDGNASKSITGVGFQPDWVVIRRPGSSSSFTGDTFHYNSTNGAAKRFRMLGVNQPNDEPTDYFKSFDSDGFSVYTNHNSNGDEYVAWCWRFNGGTTASNGNCSTTSTTQVNPDFAMSLITADPSSATDIGHGMSSTPTYTFYKKTDNSNEMYVYTTGFDGSHDGFGFGSFAETVFTPGFAAPTSTCLSIQNNDHTLWSFANSDICKIGTYTGTGSSGISVTTGFPTNFVLIKATNRGVVCIDSVRGGTKRVYWDHSSAESDSASNWEIDFGSTGFTVNGTNGQINNNGTTFLYLAFSINVT